MDQITQAWYTRKGNAALTGWSSRIWFHQKQNMHAKSKEISELEVSTTAMSSEMNNFLFLEAREGTGKEACTHQQALHLWESFGW